MSGSDGSVDKAVSDLVYRIIQRGRLYQRELDGDLKVRDGGMSLSSAAFEREIKNLAKTEAINLADELIGKDIKVRTHVLDPMEETPFDNSEDRAVLDFQTKQRLHLAQYQSIDVDDDVTTEVEDKPTDTNRIDRNKPAIELGGVTGREQYSENEE